MPTECVNCKANPVEIARNTPGTPTAKLIAILAAHGITSAADIAEIVGITDRAVRKVRNSGSGTQVPTGTPGPELQDRSGTQVPKTELQDRNSGSAPSCAGATKESLRDSYYLEKVDSPPTPSAKLEPVEGECEIAHGVLLNCKTIRHPHFTISLPAIELGVLASGLSKDQIKDHCLAHALQWGAEIEGGKNFRDVIPTKIANFLSASIMAGKVRADVAEQRTKPKKFKPSRWVS